MSRSRVTAEIGVVRVERAEEQVAGLRGAERHLGRLLVADLADHDDLGIVAQERAQVAREGVADPLVDLRLAELLVDVLDRVLRGQDPDLRPVGGHQRGVERGALARTRSAR